MEVKRQNLDGMGDPASMLRTEKDVVSIPASKFNTRNTSIIEPGGTKDIGTIISVQRRRSLEKKLESSAYAIRKTKSLSAQFLVNIDELLNNVDDGSLDETSSVISRASRKQLGFSFSLEGANLPSDDFSDVLKLKSPNCSKKSSTNTLATNITASGLLSAALHSFCSHMSCLTCFG